jgi:hypothetical protein
MCLGFRIDISKAVAAIPAERLVEGARTRSDRKLHALLSNYRWHRSSNEVIITRNPYVAMFMQERTLTDCEFLTQSRTDLFDNVVWWAAELKFARTSAQLG